MQTVAGKIEEWVLAIHHRNGGALKHLNFQAPLLATELLLDSLDLAEIVVQVEREFHFSPFDQSNPPRTWAALVDQIRGQRE